jgi:hypothetical protein
MKEMLKMRGITNSTHSCKPFDGFGWIKVIGNEVSDVFDCSLELIVAEGWNTIDDCGRWLVLLIADLEGSSMRL